MPSRPSTLLDRLTRTFEAHRDPVRAGPMAAYMRDQFPFLGIASTERRALQREVLAGTPKPSEDEVAKIARRCWALPEREYQYFACDYVRKHAERCSPALLPTLRELVTAKSWWDTVDSLAHAVGALVLAHPELAAEMDRWIADEDLWLRRVALLHQLDFGAQTDARRLFDYCARSAGETDFFARKAIGWALRQYSKTDPDAVCRFVAEHDAVLSPLSKREALRAIERRAD